METQKHIQAFIINLDKATERMKHMRSEIEPTAIPYTRIEAVYGPALAEPIKGFNEKRFNILTGKVQNLREVGCYLSHMRALKAFLESDADYGLILEDDVKLPSNLPQLLNKSIDHCQHWNLLRLSSSRKGEFLKITQLTKDYQLGYNTKVLKNTGAYLVNRTAAKNCIQKMLPMCLPYDVALDREWDYNIRAACITPFPVQLKDFPTQISKRSKRIRLYRSTTFHLFHILTRYQRIKNRKKYARDARSV